MLDCLTCIASCHQGHLASQIQALHYLPGRGIVAEGSHAALGCKDPASSQAGLMPRSGAANIPGIEEVAVVSELHAAMDDGNPVTHALFTKSMQS